ncbi:MAG: hypothetical protein NVS2B4_07530 [Ramlibacter sp.]
MARYVRTKSGTVAATDPRVFLPRRIRALLASLNGTANPALDRASTWSEDDMASMLDSLLAAGYVERRDDGTEPVPLGSASTPTSSASAGAQARSMGSVDTSAAILALISDFVMTHLPAQALQILFELDGLRTPEQFKAARARYVNHIAFLGGTASQHLAELDALLVPASATKTF